MQTIIRDKKVYSYSDLTDSLRVNIQTSKHHSYSGIVCSAVSVCTLDKGSNGVTWERHAIFKDYNKRILVKRDLKRITQKVIEEAHNEALKIFQEGEFMNEIKAQYSL